MTATAPAARPGTVPVDLAGPQPVLDVVIPVYNEETDLEPCIRRLHAHLAEHVSYPYRITVADNASTDTTLQVAERLAREFPEVAVHHLDEKGRGRALNAVWQASDAAVLAYMDVDLSTDLAALGPLVAPLLSGHSDLAIGSRLARGARVVRGPKREFISRCYNLILRSTLAAKFSDAQCGFKAIRADVARALLPHVEDTGWFFDTELLVLAQRAGLRIHEVPVDWVDDPDSSVNIVKTATADLKGIARVTKATFTGEIPVSRLREQLGRQPIGVEAPGVPPRLVTQLVRFAAIGVSSTLAYLVLFLLLRTAVGAQPANFTALLVTAIANTALNRRLTFGIRGRTGAGRHQFEGLIVFGLGLALTSGSLALLNGSTTPGLVLEITVLVLANLAATVLRFLLLRGWVFNPRRQAATQKEY
ncbi:glycosyltransferase [Amycolatopsis sp. NPDC051758]|uniref:glycosyltransferase n=1 Tax=Amycolatopsis sp. NPDC051758 TaxID=3363935 RepID=UPI0037BAC84E